MLGVFPIALFGFHAQHVYNLIIILLLLSYQGRAARQLRLPAGRGRPTTLLGRSGAHWDLNSFQKCYDILNLLWYFQGKMVFDFGMLLTMAVVLRVLAYLVLLYRTNRK